MLGYGDVDIKCCGLQVEPAPEISRGREVEPAPGSENPCTTVSTGIWTGRNEKNDRCLTIDYERLTRNRFCCGWFCELRRINRGICLHRGQLNSSLSVCPGDHPVKGHFHSRDIAIIGVFNVHGNEADPSVGIAHLPHQQARLLVKV